MTVVGKKPAGGLRNTLYDQQTRSGRRLSRGRLLLYKLAVPVAFGLGRLVWRWTRVVRVVGDPTRVQAGTDCGFDTSAGMRRVAADVVWAKLAALTEGARIASSRVF